MDSAQDRPQDRPRDKSVFIAEDIRAAIVSGELAVDQRLPSEAELSEHFNVSRSTVREALKRLAAQSLIRTQRGASGGAFVNKFGLDDACAAQVTTSALLLSMNAISFEVACESRFALERACLWLAVARREATHLEQLRAEIAVQQEAGLSDEAFCASDVRFHRALVDAAGNAVLSYQLASAIEGMMPLMNMITARAHSRGRIVELHTALADAVETQNVETAVRQLDLLEAYTRGLVAGHAAAN